MKAQESTGRILNFLRERGAEQVAHTGRSYMSHLLGVYRLLCQWGSEHDLCLAGLLHSIYNQAAAEKAGLPLIERSRVRKLIGDRAEQLVYWNCILDRAEFDQEMEKPNGRARIYDRLAGRHVDVSGEEFDDLCRIQLADWLEQAHLLGDWSYRRKIYVQMAQRIGNGAEESLRQVYELEKASPSDSSAG